MDEFINDCLFFDVVNGCVCVVAAGQEGVGIDCSYFVEKTAMYLGVSERRRILANFRDIPEGNETIIVAIG